MKKLIVNALITYSIGCLSLAIFAFLGDIQNGARNPNFIVNAVYAFFSVPITHYDVLILGKSKLISDLMAFYGGVMITVCVLYFRNLRKKKAI